MSRNLAVPLACVIAFPAAACMATSGSDDTREVVAPLAHLQRSPRRILEGGCRT